MSNPKDVIFSSHSVWDKPTRLFHWLNVILVFALTLLGIMMMFRTELGITETSGRIGLKTLHVLFGYGFAINLIIRIIWGFIGNKYARFGQIIPSSKSLNALKSDKAAVAAGNVPQYLGHSPKGKLAVFAVLLVLVTMMLTGLIRAGTDIYYPPFGGAVQSYIAADNVDASSIKPYDPTGVNEEKANALKPLKGFTGEIHEMGFYLLLLLIVLHIFAVIYTEVNIQPGIISAMFSGIKLIHGKAKDEE
ncbi:cytochrome b/b6 domain-containing protein [Shewanella acanthi]|uniref:cytochrome b/b6 domain-containing protein n=1 Tax=Shewanella acanthi TaxID=2864212 RepID=UPI001C659290|nr:cytochrome b/b6 domain-containing protein [Shewanella acanthi]QYJ77592.1 cytochrome b/b6 domain-containing protein [Shewanella acanthi]